MRKFLFTEHSQQDLIQIRRYTLLHWGSQQSTLYLNDLKKILKLLVDIPTMGKKCEDFDEDVYRFPFRSHVIYYLTASDKDIVIIAILHQAMIPEKHLDLRV